MSNTIPLNTTTWTLSATGSGSGTLVQNLYYTPVLAVSKPKANGDGFLYSTTSAGLFRFSITNSGINYIAQDLNLNWPNPEQVLGASVKFQTAELEVLPSGQFISWGAANNGGSSAIIYRFDIDLSTGEVLTGTGKGAPVPATNGLTTGVEFDKDEDIVFATVGTTATAYNNGLVRINFLTNPGLPTSISNTAQYAESQVEYAYNNNFVVASDNRLALFNSTTGALVGTLDNTSLPSAYSYYGTTVRYLPMQLDGHLYERNIGSMSGTSTIYLSGPALNNPATYSVSLFSGVNYSWSVTPAASYTLNPDGNAITINFASGYSSYSVTVQATFGNCSAPQYITKGVRVFGYGDGPENLPCCDGSGRMASPEGEVKIYPNPVTTAIELALPGDNGADLVQVYDMNGREVRTFNRPQKGQSLPLNGLVNGIYIVTVQTSGSVSTHKLVVAQ